MKKMEGRTFTQLFFLFIIIALCLLLALGIILAYEVKCKSSKDMDSNKPLIEGLNQKFNFCYKSDIIIGDNTLECKHPKNPYLMVCDKKACTFQYLKILNGSQISTP